MKFEILNEKLLKENHGDFAKCEDKWEEISEKQALGYLSVAYEVSLETEKEPRIYLKEENAINMLKEGAVILLPFIYIREKNTNPKCPICANSFRERKSSISRRDNKTMICSKCGMNEAIEDFKGYRN